MQHLPTLVNCLEGRVNFCQILKQEANVRADDSRIWGEKKERIRITRLKNIKNKNLTLKFPSSGLLRSHVNPCYTKATVNF